MDWCCFYCGEPEVVFFHDGIAKTEIKGITVFPMAAIMEGISKGSFMYKVRPPDRCFRRKYKVDIQNMRLSYSPSSKPFWRDKVNAVFKCTTPKGRNSVDLNDLVEVRKGWNSDLFNRLESRFRRRLEVAFSPQMRAILKEENCLSLVFGHAHTVVDLISPNVYTRDAWVRGLNQLMACCKSDQQKHEHDRWLKEQVRKADTNGNGSLNFEECLLLLKQLNISMSKKDARRLFDASNIRKVKLDGEDALDPEEFVNFYHSLLHRPEIEDLMKKYSVSKSTLWGPEELRIFLQKEQNVIATLEECLTIIEKFEPDKDKIEGYLSLQGFQEMLLSVEFNVFNKKHRIIYQDMTQPLSHYYIASSHNTYLIQDQLIGNSSIEGYIRALTTGCRCIELDVWDGTDDEPEIYHGYTLTSRILLRDVLEAIKQYAFHSSQYPLILSIENHCGASKQVKMAQLFVSILGEYLYKGSEYKKETQYPSPEALARKILIKAKKMKVEETSEKQHSEPKDVNEVVKAVAIVVGSLPPKGEPDSNLQPLAAPSRSHTVAKELSDLVSYCSSRKFQSFEECKSWKFYQMASFEETTALNFGSTEGEDFVSYNKRNLSRIYPKGTRTHSSNYDPLSYWNFGCQMVALNYQTDDEHMFMHHAKFAQNGKCGYILKPRYLREKDVHYEPFECPHPGYQLIVLINVISGQYLPKPGKATEGEVVDPYVSIKLTGHPCDEQKKKTNHIHNNGFNPVWNEVLKFKVQAPDAAMIIFRVKDQNSVGKNELLGQFALPYTSMTEGYRYVHLQDSTGEPLTPATIFIHVQVVHKKV